ncbi:TonB-dependent receptor plug domain-containing protein [Sphingomonas sp. Leaf10]|uniref:TonB-dependent receptor plug domain-containing protein n=1 Tax=Sphingomonas sp. Leaf10 TaxID=1735676 RepID=UPI00070120AF|nr:TonB-dependent receptor [Sphingomonas sp. Leaf10]KQM36068.1 hypothetical protein ASE59_15500 [Sphingomonas sp. Leaf10]
MKQSTSRWQLSAARGVIALTALLAAASAGAQEVSTEAAPSRDDRNIPIPSDPAAQSAADASDGQEIVVTGSRLRRPDFDTPSPVISLGAATIQQSGTTNITDFLAQLPALQGSTTSADTAGSGAGIGGAGLNLLDLRNLGTQRTLVLIDGRRQVASVPGSQAIDISTIPSDLVQRVDVLTGGASAIYGADAVTGVVNFILRKDFEGVTARGQAGISEYGDAGKRLIAITAGKNFGDGRGNIAVAYEYGDESRLKTRDRRYLRGTEQVGFFTNPADPDGEDNGVPDNVPLNNIRYFDTARQGGIDVDFDGFPDFIVDGGRLVAFDPGTYVPEAYQQGGNATLVSDFGNDLLPEIKRHNANAIARFEFSPAFEVFVEGKYAHSTAYTLGQPSFDFNLLIPADNPYLPAGLPTLVNGGVLVTRDNFDIGQRGATIARETMRGVSGVRGAVTPNANYELSYTWGQSRIENRYVNDVYDDRYYAAIDAVRGPNGQITCRVNVDPSWRPNQPYNSTRQRFQPTTFAPGECVPLNLFGEGVASQAAYDFVRANTTDRSTLRQQVVTGSLSGDTGAIFKLPGGPVSFVLGGEYRKEESAFRPDPIAARGLTFTNALGATRGEFDVKEGFAELGAPLLRDVPFFHRLTFSAALRLSDYSTIGGTTTWKVDGTWAPIRDITFNGTYSKAVRAPNIGELFNGRSQTFQFITDPCNLNQLQNGTEFRRANCQTLLSGLGVANPAAYRDTRSSNIPGFSGGNANLKEEEGTTWTAGVVVQPRFIPGLTVRGDWYDIKLAGAINTVTSAQLAQLCVDQPTLDNVFCQSITRTNVAVGSAQPGNIVGFNVGPQNVAGFNTAGLDLNVNYRLDTAKAGTFNLRFIGNYLDKLEFIGTPGAPITNRRQESAFRAPKFTATADLTWSLDNLTVNYGINFLDKTLRYSNQTTDNNPDVVAPEYKYIKQVWQHELYLAVDATDNFQFYGGVNNLFGQRPDLADSSYIQQIVGRYVFAGARVKM